MSGIKGRRWRGKHARDEIEISPPLKFRQRIDTSVAEVAGNPFEMPFQVPMSGHANEVQQDPTSPMSGKSEMRFHSAIENIPFTNN